MWHIVKCNQLNWFKKKKLFSPFRIERLWRDVWLGVTQLYYDILHSLEEDGLLDLSDSLHVFCTHYVFIPRLQRDLHTFSEGWDNHPLRSEGGLTPNQLWVLGHMQNSTQDEEELQVKFLLNSIYFCCVVKLFVTVA